MPILNRKSINLKASWDLIFQTDFGGKWIWDWTTQQKKKKKAWFFWKDYINLKMSNLGLQNISSQTDFFLYLITFSAIYIYSIFKCKPDHWDNKSIHNSQTVHIPEKIPIANNK